MNRWLVRWAWLSLGLALIVWGSTRASTDLRAAKIWLALKPASETSGDWVVSATSGQVDAGAGNSPAVRENLPLSSAKSSISTAVSTAADPEDGFLVQPGQAQTPTPASKQQTPQPVRIPDRIVIPSIHLDAPVILAQSDLVNVAGQLLPQWLAPDQFAAGWHTSSAPLGQPGNTVLNGHHNEFGEVFGHLVDLRPGDEIVVYAGGFARHYVVANRMILPERNQPLQTRLDNARWLAPTTDERLTLITCWPHQSNTHRLVIVATPLN